MAKKVRKSTTASRSEPERVDIRRGRVIGPLKGWVCFFSDDRGVLFIAAHGPAALRGGGTPQGSVAWDRGAVSLLVHDVMGMNPTVVTLTILVVPQARVDTLIQSEKFVRQVHEWDQPGHVGEATRKGGRIRIEWGA